MTSIGVLKVERELGCGSQGSITAKEGSISLPLIDDRRVDISGANLLRTVSCPLKL